MGLRRTAVIGSGISGLSVAYFLAPHRHITLYERDARLGGHANTARITIQGQVVDVDTGFMVFNPARYPHLVALFKELTVETVPTDMSFSVSDVFEYSSFVSGLFGDMRQNFSPAYWQLLLGILRFNRAAKKFVRDPRSSRSLLLESFLNERGFSRTVREQYLYPMMGSIWSSPIGDMGAYTAYDTFRFLDNHLLLDIVNKPVWRTVRGGARTYVDALESLLIREGVVIKKGVPVERVRRGSSVTVSTLGADTLFDEVVFAAHADTAQKLLTDLDDRESEALGAFSYSKNRVVLHSDTSFMPRRRTAWASWNYHPRLDSATISLTYNMNMLQHISESQPCFVTLNPAREPKKELVHGSYEYDHPVFNARARKGQDAVELLQGVRNTYYAGAHLGYGFHEDGIVSAAHVIQKMGLPLRLSL